MIRESKKRKSIFIYIIIFLIIFTPRVAKSMLFNPRIGVWIILPFLIFPLIRIRKKYHKSFNLKQTYIYMLLIILSSIYYLCRYVFSKGTLDFIETRLLQNLWPIASMLCLTVLLANMKELDFSFEDSMKALVWVATVQGLICVAMILIPSLKSFAEQLYMNGTEKFAEGSFFFKKRIYGVGSDYTYGMPIVCGMISGISFFLALDKDIRYAFNTILICICSILNGVTGLVIALLSISIAFIFCVDLSKMKFTRLIAPACISSMLYLLVLYAQERMPEVYRNVMNGITSIFEGTGEIEYFTSSRLFFPEGIGLIIGEGYTLRGIEATKLGVIHSDIGFVNDVFMGGLLYILFRYSAVFSLLLFWNNSKFRKYIATACVCMWMIANWKGQATVCSAIIVLIQYIYLSKVYLDNSTVK